jgi:ATP-binding cassette subfamily G (WHITE) protein 2 (SNQ2)
VQTVYFGAIDHLSDYFSGNEVRIPKNKNPAEFMIDVVSGDLSKGRDWAKVWLESEECSTMMKEIDSLKEEYKGKKMEEREDDGHEYASTKSAQLRLVTKRATVQVSLSQGGVETVAYERVVVEEYRVCDE